MSQPPTFTDEQQVILRHEAMMAEVMKLRSPRRTSDERPRWLQVLESSAVTTLVTVVVGGFLGNLFVSWYQARQKNNEQSLAEYRQYLHKEEEIVEHAYDVLGTAYLNAHQTLDLTRVSFQEKNFAKDDRKIIRAQRAEITDKINDFRAVWEKEREQIGFRLSFYHYGRPEVATAWRNAKTALEKLISCSDMYYDKYLTSKANVNGTEALLCSHEDKDYGDVLRALSEEITAARRYSWQQLGVPKPEESATTDMTAQ